MFSFFMLGKMIVRSRIVGRKSQVFLSLVTILMEKMQQTVQGSVYWQQEMDK